MRIFKQRKIKENQQHEASGENRSREKTGQMKIFFYLEIARETFLFDFQFPIVRFHMSNERTKGNRKEMKNNRSWDYQD